MHPKRSCTAAAFAAWATWVLVGTAPSGAAVAFSGTGEEFFGDPQASFPTGAPGVSGTSLDLPADANSEVLATYPLAAAGAFAGPGTAVITYTVGLTRLSDDFDPVFLVGDGTNLVGGQVGDNPNGSARAIEGTLAGTSVTTINDPLLFQDAGFPAIGESVEAVVGIVLGDAGSEVTVAFLGTEATFAASQVLDRDQPLSFLLVANSQVGTGELYRLDQATLEIAAPEPAHALLFAAGALALAAVARARR